MTTHATPSATAPYLAALQCIQFATQLHRISVEDIAEPGDMVVRVSELAEVHAITHEGVKLLSCLPTNLQSLPDVAHLLLVGKELLRDLDDLDENPMRWSFRAYLERAARHHAVRTPVVYAFFRGLRHLPPEVDYSEELMVLNALLDEKADQVIAEASARACWHVGRTLRHLIEAFEKAAHSLATTAVQPSAPHTR